MVWWAVVEGSWRGNLVATLSYLVGVRNRRRYRNYLTIGNYPDKQLAAAQVGASTPTFV